MHAYLTDEAFAIAFATHHVNIGDAEGQVDVLIPHPFAFLILKLFALRDRLQKANDAKQKYHAFDLYAIWADMSPDEYHEVRDLVHEHSGHPVVREVAKIVATHFAQMDAPGAICARRAGWNSRSSPPTLDAVERFMRDLLELFAVAEESGRR
ncbi:MAG: hypothetical protein IPF87_24920 [Gemmatimonadetes bacterium]|nr:hypothetical protein [Gemmatimonadota bacterium]